MAMTCCHKEYDAEKCEILVCMDAPAPYNLNLYQRLRFGLLASSWLPSPVGIFLWSALHVMLLIVGGPILWVFCLLYAFFISVFLLALAEICLGSLFVVCGLIAVAVDLVLLVVESLRFCWSLVGSLACHEHIVEWKGGARWTVEFWKSFKHVIRGLWRGILAPGVPCMSGSFYEQTKDELLETSARWCEEVVHMHKAIAV